MQPDNSPESLAAILHLESTGACLFDCKRFGPRLMPIIFNSSTNFDHEKYYYSFVGEIACGCWAISRLRKYLWGTLFYWLCDCKAIKEIIEYNGSIHQIKRWSQELLAYEFVIIHRLAAMIQDVDGISRYIDLLVHQHTITTSRLHTEDVTERPFAYSFDVFHRCNNQRHVTASNVLSISITIATNPSIPTLYHTPIKFSTIFSIRPVFPIKHQATDWLTLPVPVPVTPSPPITWISFDSVINFLTPLLLSQGYNVLQHILCESDQLFFSLNHKFLLIQQYL